MAVTRRQVLGTFGAAMAAPGLVAASPARPVGTPTSTASITREAYAAQLGEYFGLTEPEARGGVLIFGESTDIQTLNPIITADSYSGTIVRLLFHSLVRTSPIDGYPAPDLADWWETSADGTVYTFHLPPAATWHDGQPVTAADVAFSFDVTLDENSPSPRGWTVADAVASYRVVDDHLFEVTTRGPQATALSAIGLVGVIPKHVWHTVPIAELAGDPGSTGTDPARVVGCGPFRFREWVIGDHVELVRNERYWDPTRMPAVDSFYYRIVPDSNSVADSLRVGEIHFCNLDLTSVDQLSDDPGLEVMAYDTNGLNWFDMMLDADQTPFFTDVRVRQALMYALDRELMAEQIYHGYAIAAEGFLPPLHIAWDPASIRTDYRQDVEKAKALLSEAGWIDSDGDGIREKDGQPFRFDAVYSEGFAIYGVQLPYMQQAWREIGIDMRPSAIPFTTLTQMGRERSYVMRIRGYNFAVDAGLGVVFSTTAITEGFNSMGYSNPVFDELDAEQLGTLDRAERIALLQEENNIAYDDVAAGPLVFVRKALGRQRRVRNLAPAGYDPLWSIPQIWLAEGVAAV